MTRLRDIDSSERSFLIRLGGLAGVPLFVLLYIVERAYAPVAFWLFIIADVAITVVVVFTLWVLIGHAGKLTNSLLMPSGTPPVREYSEQETLVSRGRIADAIDSYRAFIVAYPEDLDAKLRLGALLADHGADPTAAEQCYLEVRASGASARQETVIANALIDLYRFTNRRADLKRELSRFARLNPRSRAGVQARRYLRQLAREDASQA